MTTLTLQNYRSYSKYGLNLTPETTLISGPNASGKTNLLEAIYMLSTGKSFRTNTDKETLRWNSEVGRIGATTGSEKVEIVLTGGSVQGQKTAIKKFLVNSVARRQIDFVGNLRSVIFWPEDLDLVTDSPSLRRKYLDSVLVQVDREYRRNLYSYERGLRQRNKLLDLINEGKSSRNQLLFWNQLLIKSGGYITDKRGEFIEYVNSNEFIVHSSEIENKGSKTYRIEYDKSVISEGRLEQYKNEEVAAKYTLVGPHRDDFVFKIAIGDKRDEISETQEERSRMKAEKYNTSDLSLITSYFSLTSYGSRGEQRLGVLWLKLAELEFITEKTGDRPVLLLDDIFSELDDEHRRLVVDLVKKQQTIVTTAEEDVQELLEKSGIEYQVVRLK